jgi:sialate O-acetylesterase
MENRPLGSNIPQSLFGPLFLFAAVILPSAILHSQQSQFQISPVFQDSMVLQQRTNVPVWGKGIPLTRVTAKASWGSRGSAVVGPDSMWNLKLSTPKAGGPYVLSVRHGDSTANLKNILIGEVWICSGQSNMEMPLEGWPPNDTIWNSASAIEHSFNPKIRLFHVQRNYSVDPVSECVGTWRVCSPSSVRTFSATAYFFGKRLQESLKVPIGLIEASWGGTAVESWMSKEMLSKFGEYTATLKKIDECREGLPVLEHWLAQRPMINVTSKPPQQKWEGLQFQDEGCADRDFPDSAWLSMTLPTLWERTSLGEFDGVVWFRKQVEIPSAWIGKALTLHLGPIDDMDETYVNGKKVGGIMKDGFWKAERVYTIPDSVVSDSVLQIAVRVLDTQGGGGIWGDGKAMFVSSDSSETKIPLEGSWKYLPVAEYRVGIFWVYGATDNQFRNRPKLPLDFSGYTPTALFNGMISPIVPFAIRGAIWYQGESNTDKPALYKETFPAMIADWRKAFRQGDFPFYFVQIAPFNYGGQTNSQLLREAQFQTLNVKNTGMAVTLDIGNPKNIHPANKEGVGTRLALWSLAKTYGRKVECSGPLYKSMRIVKGTIVISFDHAGKGLVLRDQATDQNFTIAGEDKVFKKATVKVDGKKVVVFHTDVQSPQAVRYAWSDTAQGTLFNKEGLPASSFRTDAW